MYYGCLVEIALGDKAARVLPNVILVFFLGICFVGNKALFYSMETKKVAKLLRFLDISGKIFINLVSGFVLKIDQG